MWAIFRAWAIFRVGVITELYGILSTSIVLVLDNWDIKEHHSSNYTVLTGAYYISTISMVISRHTITSMRT